MAKKKMQVRIVYNKARDSYDLMLRSDETEEWGLEIGCKCQRSAHDPNAEEAEFVSIGLIEQLRRDISLGAELIY